MSDPTSEDLTPESASPTDVAPLGRQGEKPPHEHTAEEEAGTVPWQAIADDPAFKELLIAKSKFVVPMSIFFMVYVVFGGMLATTRVQIIKAILLLSGNRFQTLGQVLLIS